MFLFYNNYSDLIYHIYKNYNFLNRLLYIAHYNKNCKEYYILHIYVYYIHKYLFEKDSSKVKLFTIYKYDKENDVLVDVQDETNICNIEYRETIGKKGIPKKYYVCNPVKLKFNNERDKMFIKKLENSND